LTEKVFHWQFGARIGYGFPRIGVGFLRNCQTLCTCKRKGKGGY